MKKHRNRRGRFEVIKRELAIEYIQLHPDLPERRPSGSKGRRCKNDPGSSYVRKGAEWIDEQLREMRWTQTYRIENTRFVMQRVIEEMRGKTIPAKEMPFSSIGRSLRLLIITSH